MINSKLMIVQAGVLPEVFEKVVEAKKLLQSGEVSSIQEACKAVNLSRSAFYKYKDYVFDYAAQEQGKMMILFMILKHEPGVLSNVLNVIASVKGNIITINQDIPIRDTACVTMTVNIKSLELPPDKFVKLIAAAKGCKKVKIVAME